MTARVTKKEDHFEDLMTRLWAAKREVAWARDELGVERNCHIVVEDSFIATLKAVVNKKVAEAVALALMQAEAERENILEGTLQVATAKYLASDAFETVKC